MIRPAYFRAYAILIGLAAFLAIRMHWSSGAHVWILLGGVAVGLALQRAQPAEWRATFGTILGLGLATRVVLHVALYAWATAAGGPFLSSDATLYFSESLQLAEDDFAIGAPPWVFFRTYDCAHYFLFAGARWLVDADLFALQTLNIVIASMVGPLVYAIARRLDVPYAATIGTVVALYPSLVALSINDLMKDAGVIGLSMLGIWAIVEAWMGQPSVRRRAALVAIAVVALSYVRMSRFYVPAFLAVGLLAAVGAALLLRRTGRTTPGLPVIASLVLTLALVELVPMSFGWPWSPVMVSRALNHTLETPAMRLYATGLVDRLQAGGEVGPRHRGDVGVSGPTSVRASDVLDKVVKAGASQVPRPTRNLAPDPVPPPAAAPAQPETPRAIAMRIAANGVRKLFGPFPWILPPAWDARTILVGDYLLFPGMVIWYLLLPVALIGLVVVPWRAMMASQCSWPLVGLAVFVSLLFAQYMVLNLSYRQREFMFPFLALAAACAVHLVGRSAWSRIGYATYVVGLVAMAVVHLSLRSAL